jgi:hypothetical protein
MKLAIITVIIAVVITVKPASANDTYGQLWLQPQGTAATTYTAIRLEDGWVISGDTKNGYIYVPMARTGTWLVTAGCGSLTLTVEGSPTQPIEFDATCNAYLPIVGALIQSTPAPANQPIVIAPAEEPGNHPLFK